MYVLVERLIAVHVRDAVHQKRNVQRDAEAKVEVHPERQPQALVPAQPRHQHRHAERQHGEQHLEPALLPHDDPVRLQVAHVDGQPLLDDGRVRRQEHPADVREEEAASRVMRIRIGLRVFVMDTMVERPCVSVALENVAADREGMTNYRIGNDWAILRMERLLADCGIALSLE